MSMHSGRVAGCDGNGVIRGWYDSRQGGAAAGMVDTVARSYIGILPVRTGEQLEYRIGAVNDHSVVK